MSLQSNLKSGI